MKPTLSSLLLRGALLINGLLLSGCHPFVKYPSTAFGTRTAATSAVGGAAVGAHIAGMSGASAAVASANVGALVGIGVGAYMSSPPRLLKKLQQQRVQVVQTGDQVRIIIPSDCLFQPHNALLTPNSYLILNNVAGFISNYGAVALIVSGYTDDINTEDRNYILSRKQAKSVLGFLWTHGFPSARLSAIGHGENNPIAENIGPQGRAFNRRIEITFAIA